MRFFLGCFVSSLMGAAISLCWQQSSPTLPAHAQDREETTRAQQVPPLLVPPLADDERVFNTDGISPEEAINVAVYETLNRSVVNITTKTTKEDVVFLIDVESAGTGSGSVIDKSGHIVTNYHVVENAQQVQVTLFDGKSYDATFVGADPINDIAVIKITAPQDVLFPVEFGDSGNLKVGHRVFAIGNPFGLERTMTTGIISSLNRSLQLRANRTIKSIIQIDAAVNPGNSGGPLADSRGRLIGINTAIASTTGQSAGVGFAIPVNLVARVVPQLIEHGQVIRPEIGIIRVFENEQGLLVAKLSPDGPAEKAGLRGPKITRQRRGPFVVEREDRSAADLIVQVDGQDVKSADDFLGFIESKSPGDEVELTIVREGRKLAIRVRLNGSAEKAK
ncbi:MAG: S1C family serine protease [Planctomycetaceae bacterium]